MFTRCPFCHKLVLRWFYAAHERKHTERRSDGQMMEHATKPPDQRYSGTLDGIPQAYRHELCGVVTKMPEEIIRSYLVNPLMYNDGSFCCGCGDYVSSAGLSWEETGEKVMDYMGRLRAEHLRRVYGLVLPDRVKEVVITPAAVRAIHTIARQQGLSSYFFALGLAEDGSGVNYIANLAPTRNSRDEVVLKSSGIQVIVPRGQVELFHGVVVDYQQGATEGFLICRLYAPN